MNSRKDFLKSVFLWILCLIPVLFIPGCGGGKTSAIRQVIRRDKELSQHIQHPYSWNGSGSGDEYMDRSAETIFWYVQEARKFDTSSVPVDFAIAYREHLRAWEFFGQNVRNHPIYGTFTSNFLKGALRGLMGDVTGGALEQEALFRNWETQLKQADQEIESTWEAVQQSAIRHGVNVGQ